MKSDYSNQADVVKYVNEYLKDYSKTGLPLNRAVLNEAETSLRALALIGEATVLRAQALEKIARELVMEVITDDRELNFAEVRRYAEDFNKVLNPITKEVV